MVKSMSCFLLVLLIPVITVYVNATPLEDLFGGGVDQTLDHTDEDLFNKHGNIDVAGAINVDKGFVPPPPPPPPIYPTCYHGAQPHFFKSRDLHDFERKYGRSVEVPDVKQQVEALNKTMKVRGTTDDVSEGLPMPFPMPILILVEKNNSGKMHGEDGGSMHMRGVPDNMSVESVNASHPLFARLAPLLEELKKNMTDTKSETNKTPKAILFSNMPQGGMPGMPMQMVTPMTPPGQPMMGQMGQQQNMMGQQQPMMGQQQQQQKMGESMPIDPDMMEPTLLHPKSENSESEAKKPNLTMSGVNPKFFGMFSHN